MSIINEFVNEYVKVKKKELKEGIASCEEYLDGSKKYKSNVKELKRYRFKQKALQYLREFYPTIISLGLIPLFSSLVIENGPEYPLVTRETVDSTGNNKVMHSYLENYDKNADRINYYSKWELNKNNQYERTIRRYNTNKLSPEVIKLLISNEKTINSMDDIFGKAISVEKEIGRDLTEDELDTPEYIEAVLYSKDVNDVVTLKYSTSDKIGIIALVSIGFLGIDYVYTCTRYIVTEFNLDEELIDIDKNYLYHLKRLCDKEENKKTRKLKK